ncbi:hypothetical protein C1I60_16205 [Paenibacillus terrae]|uniref:Uncharacterized protein n=1 Tax=Paenibacillus terrae TaxID=159743 RepID=A0A4V5SPQ7_9BACL|nr:hypothetical protein [Paenibacillus terrae]TKH43061.1 hypothetical protein C1I60_16205 [Paenibacillus terrae]
MNHTYKVLKSRIELFAAALSQVRVYVVKPLSEDMVGVVDYLFAAPEAQRLFILHYKGKCQRRCHQVQT